MLRRRAENERVSYRVQPLARRADAASRDAGTCRRRSATRRRFWLAAPLALLLGVIPVLAIAAGRSASTDTAGDRGSATPGLHPSGPAVGEARPGPRAPQVPPTAGEIVCPAEFGRADGVFLTYETTFGSTAILIEIAAEAAERDTVYMIVKNVTERSQAVAQLTAAGVDLDRVQFILYPQLSENSIWVRDYGPAYIHADGPRGIVDFWYPFTNDDDLPLTIGQTFGLPVYTTDLMLSGGNFMTDGNGIGFCTEIVYTYNPSYTHAQVRQVFRDYCGIDSLVVLPILDVENTKHIDVFCKILDATTILVGEYASPAQAAGDNYAILNQIAAQLDTLRSLEGREFEVARIPMPPYERGRSVGVTRTYTNSLILNDKVLVPVYGQALDAEALAMYAGILPDHEIVPIDAEQIIHRAGAVHCITSLHHGPNPLLVHHTPLDSIAAGSAPVLTFATNPRFADMTARVFYRPVSSPTFASVPATRTAGVWHATLPEADEAFDYYLCADAVSGTEAFTAYAPREAPADLFHVALQAAAAVAERVPSGTVLVCPPALAATPATLQLHVAPGEAARVTIHDAQGRRVRPLGAHGPGDHTILWDGRDARGIPLPAGVYFCRVRATRATHVGRILLLR